MFLRKNHTQLEKIAEDFLSRHGKFDNRALIVDLTVENYGYEIWPLRGLGQIAEAFIPRKEGIVFVDEEQMLDHPVRFRFTLAEELAHILIHVPSLRGKSPEELQKMHDMMTAQQYRWFEHDAKYLASCLLMRQSWFIERFRAHRDVQAKRISNRSHILRYTVRQLGMDFAVPPAAAAQRAFKLKLIDEGDLFELGY